LASAGLTSEEQKALTAFQDDVIKPSMEKLVILDFWAEWCEPCKQFTPILEKISADYAGKGVILAKIDVDQNKFIASQFQVRSIPTVYALFQGQPVADLTQARTEAQLIQVLDELLEKLPIDAQANEGGVPPEQLAAMIKAAEEALSNDEAPTAYEICRQILTVLPDNLEAISATVRAMVALGEAENAQQFLDQLPDDKKSDPIITRAQSAITLAAERKAPDEVEILRQNFEQNPDDHAIGFELANALFAAGDKDMTSSILLNIIAKDRDWNEGAARSRLLEIFELVGLENPWTAQNRRKLSAILFG